MRSVKDLMTDPGKYHWWASAAVLREFDTSGLTEPTDEIRNYLLARYEARLSLHPRVFEETVAAVFRDIGYDALVTAYSGDGGIDIVLSGPTDRDVAVQVKRYTNSIGVEMIRAFTGAMVLGGFTKGIFVTTSRFQSGAGDVVRKAASRGIALDLVDAGRLFDALHISRQDAPLTGEESFLQAPEKLHELGVDEYRPLREWLEMAGHSIDHSVEQMIAESDRQILKSQQAILRGIKSAR